MITMYRIKYMLLLGSFLCTTMVFAQSKTSTDSISSVRKPLPGMGLQQHDFLYTGEWDYRKPVQTIYIVRKGKIVWTHDIPFHDPATGEMEELGDATMRPNGNIAFCRKTGASEITPDKKLIWNYEALMVMTLHIVELIYIYKL